MGRRLRRAEKRIDALSNRLARITRTKKSRRRRQGDKASLFRDRAVLAFIERNMEGNSAADIRRLVRDTYGEGRTPSRSVVAGFIRSRHGS